MPETTCIAFAERSPDMRRTVWINDYMICYSKPAVFLDLTFVDFFSGVPSAPGMVKNTIFGYVSFPK